MIIQQPLILFCICFVVTLQLYCADMELEIRSYVGTESLERNDSPDDSLLLPLPDELRERFFQCVKEGYPLLVQRILDAGATIDAVDQEGMTALIHACRQGRAAIVELLLERGACPNRLDDRNKGAIAYAAEQGSPAIVLALLARGASIRIADQNGFVPMSHAAINGHFDALNCFLQHDALERERTGQTIFQWGTKQVEGMLLVAIARKHDSVVRVLLEHGAQANCSDFPEQPLSIAFDRANKPICDLLKAHGADISCLGPHKRRTIR